MLQESMIFRFQTGKRFWEKVALVSLITVILVVLDSQPYKIVAILVGVLLTSLLLFVISISHILYKALELGVNSITLHKRLGQSISIPLQEVRRITIKEEENPLGINHQIMTLFGTGRNIRITVSDLDDPNTMIEQLEQKGEALGFAVIHQGATGKIIKRSKDRAPH